MPSAWRRQLHYQPKGPGHPAYKHGLYSRYLAEAEVIELEEWQQSFDLLKLSHEELFALFRLQKALCSPGPIPVLPLAQAVLSLARIKATFRQAREGMEVRVRLEREDVQRLLQATVQVLSRYVPDDVLADATCESR